MRISAHWCASLRMLVHTSAHFCTLVHISAHYCTVCNLSGSRVAELNIWSCFPSVDPHSLDDLPQGIQPEFIWLAKVGCLLHFLCDHLFFIKSEAVLVRKLGRSACDRQHRGRYKFIASKTRTCQTKSLRKGGLRKSKSN